jgi:membrane protein required for colicin V production
MNKLDLIFAIPLAYGAYKGFQKGFIYEIAILMALILGVMGGVKLSEKASAWLSNNWDIQSEMLPFISFLLVFIAILVLVILFAKLLEGVLKASGLSVVNQLAGAMLGLLKWTLIISLVMHLFVPLQTKHQFISQETRDGSFFYSPVNSFSSYIVPAIGEMKNKFIERFRSEEPA